MRFRAAALSLALSACEPAAPPLVVDPTPTPTSPVSEVTGEGDPPVIVHPALLLVVDPAVLIELERELEFDRLVEPKLRAAIIASLEQRLARDRAEDPEHTGVGLRFVHRQFDIRWLTATDTRFELIGVVNRMDRHVFAADRGFGETRLIYRLAYTRSQDGTTVDSRLPMTVNVVFWQRPAGELPIGEARVDAMRELAARWQADPVVTGTALAEWLREPGRPLASEHVVPTLLKSVEVDVQTERWPATIRPDMAGHAEYLLQVFEPDERGRWQPAPLENTPDVDRLAGDRAAKAELLAWLLDPAQRSALLDGTVVVPDQFLARSATSVTPRGFGRAANRPWSRLFGPDDFSEFVFDDTSPVRSPAALLRRLDGLSCHGCHETRSVAGFHLLGEERDAGKRVDALQLATSPHLDGELDRRAAWFDALLSGEARTERRDLADHEHARGAWGSHCGLGDSDVGFAHWTCASGLQCVELSDPELGTCLEVEPAGAGGVCEVGRVKRSTNHHRDRIVGVQDRPCADGGVCNDNGVGFPEGMCAFSCAADRPEGECGVIPNLRSFNDCLARRQPFATCIVETSNPAALRGCNREAPCRDDYICARSGSDRGVCLPPYFLFQLRVDGHPQAG